MLKTERLILRAPREDDLDAMFALYRDPLVMKYWSTPPHENREVTRELLNRQIAHWATAPLNFQIELDGQYIGGAGNFWKNEIGFILSPDHWRKGYASEAMRKIIPHVFTSTDHTGLTADADAENEASVGLLTSLGFVETHRAQNTFCIKGVWVHSIYMALQRPVK